MLKLIAIVGPTGVGKTKLSIALAKHYDAEIINCDAMQVYEGMDIGTAKVTTEEMDGIPHHLLSFVPVTRNYTVFDYQNASNDQSRLKYSCTVVSSTLMGSTLYLATRSSLMTPDQFMPKAKS